MTLRVTFGIPVKPDPLDVDTALAGDGIAKGATRATPAATVSRGRFRRAKPLRARSFWSVSWLRTWVCGVWRKATGGAHFGVVGRGQWPTVGERLLIAKQLVH